MGEYYESEGFYMSGAIFFTLVPCVLGSTKYRTEIICFVFFGHSVPLFVGMLDA